MNTHNQEYQYTKELFCIKTLSNLHVGSGSENYGVIDNLIQRDAATGFPCIHASSLKGAFREFFVKDIQSKPDFINHVFGSEKGSSEVADTEETESETMDGNVKLKVRQKTQPGKYRFLQADILSLPVRAMTMPYVNITCTAAIQNIQSLLGEKKIDLLTTLHSIAKNNAEVQFFFNGNVDIETDEGKSLPFNATDLSTIKPIIGSHPGVVQDKTFVEAVSDFGLPVIARNQLNDGKSGNLWYEQVLPRESRLLFFVLVPKGDIHFTDFKKNLNENLVQIGANASVGYGVCQVSHIVIT
jgi:CRISPR-associated protein Cmr4